MQLSDLGLSPYQLHEIEELDEGLVASWLDASDDPSVRSPTGFFLTGVRSGKPPTHGGGPDDRARAVHLSEVWIRNCGLYCDRAEEMEDELFHESRGRLRFWSDDRELRARMSGYWDEQRKRGIQGELEFDARSERARAAQAAKVTK